MSSYNLKLTIFWTFRRKGDSSLSLATVLIVLGDTQEETFEMTIAKFLKAQFSTTVSKRNPTAGTAQLAGTYSIPRLKHITVVYVMCTLIMKCSSPVTHKHTHMCTHGLVHTQTKNHVPCRCMLICKECGGSKSVHLDT